MTKPKKRLPNVVIVILKIVSALSLFFACCLFFFSYPDIFARDFGFDETAPLGSAENPWYNLLFPVAFSLGICFIIYYLANMIIRFERKELWRADRLFVTYQIVFIALLLIIIWRWFFINISNAVAPSVIMVIAGLINLLTPKIVDNNNTDF